MASDRLVTPQHVLKAVMEHERRGATKLLSELEALEPDLAEWLLENSSRLYHDLTHMGLSGREARKAHRSAVKMVLVCIMALRVAYRELWDKGSTESDPDPADSPVSPSP